VVRELRIVIVILLITLATYLTQRLRTREAGASLTQALIESPTSSSSHVSFLKQMSRTAAIAFILVLLDLAVNSVFRIRPCSIAAWGPMIPAAWAVYGHLVPSTRALRGAAGSLMWALTFGHPPAAILPTPRDFDDSTVAASRKHPCVLALCVGAPTGFFILFVLRLGCNYIAQMMGDRHFNPRVNHLANSARAVRAVFWPY